MAKNDSKFARNNIAELMNNSFNTDKNKTNNNTVNKKSSHKLNTKLKDQHKKVNHKSAKPSKPNKAKKNKSKQSKKIIANQHGVLPMSCTLDIRTIGKLDSAKQVLGLHNRNDVVEQLIQKSKSLDELLNSDENKKNYKMFYKVFMMKHKKQAERHYKQFYKNGKNNK